MKSSFYEPIDLTDQLVQESFSKYLMFWMNKKGITPESFSGKAGISIRQLQRYLPGAQRRLPKKIPIKTFNDLLFTVGKTHDEFYSAYLLSIEKPNNKSESPLNNDLLIDASDIAGISWMFHYTPNTSVQHFLDSIWSQLAFYIDPYQYGQTWTLEKINTNTHNTKHYFEQFEKDINNGFSGVTLEAAGVLRRDQFKVVEIT